MFRCTSRWPRMPGSFGSWLVRTRYIRAESLRLCESPFGRRDRFPSVKDVLQLCQCSDWRVSGPFGATTGTQRQSDAGIERGGLAGCRDKIDDSGWRISGVIQPQVDRDVRSRGRPNGRTPIPFFYPCSAPFGQSYHATPSVSHATSEVR